MIPYARQHLDHDDIAAVVDTLKSPFITQGPRILEFEQAFAKAVGARYAVAVSNGTAALHLSCLTWGIEGLPFSVPTLTFVATANAVVMAGGKPKLIDIVGPHGLAVGADVSVDFAGLPTAPGIIEDACHALGGELLGKEVGSYAPMTCFSFHPVKHITTGEGGMVTTNNPVHYAKLLSLRDHGRTAGECCTLGYNYRMTDIQAALGISQLKKLPWFIERRREIAHRYCKAFDMPFIEGHAYHLFVILIEDRDEVRRKLAEKGVGSQIHYKPVHLQPFYQKTYGYKMGDFPKAERYWRHCLSIPMFPAMTDAEVEQVIEAVKSCDIRSVGL